MLIVRFCASGAIDKKSSLQMDNYISLLYSYL